MYLKVAFKRYILSKKSSTFLPSYHFQRILSSNMSQARTCPHHRMKILTRDLHFAYEYSMLYAWSQVHMIGRGLTTCSKAQDLISKKQKVGKPVIQLPIPEWPPNPPTLPQPQALNHESWISRYEGKSFNDRAEPWNDSHIMPWKRITLRSRPTRFWPLV